MALAAAVESHMRDGTCHCIVCTLSHATDPIYNAASNTPLDPMQTCKPDVHTHPWMAQNFTFQLNTYRAGL